MSATISEPPAAPSAVHEGRGHIRGSSLLLLGRGLALLINLAVQVITVRYLTKEEFGAFAFALTMVALGSNVAILGLTKSMARFVPIYHERGERDHMAGAIVLMLGMVLGLGLALIVGVFGLRGLIAAHAGNSLSVSLLLLLIALVPIEALDRMFESLFAVFGSVKSVFFRRHLLGPGLKLLAVVFVVVVQGSVQLLSTLYLLAGVAGLLLYGWLLNGAIAREDLSGYFRPSRWKMPVREILSYSLPLFSSQIGFVVRTSLAVLLLAVLRGSSDVAEFRAVFPFARLNEVVLVSFGFLFTPLAARFFARNDTASIDQLYWNTSVWIAILSLPAFLITGVLARPFITLVLGERYESAAGVLMILAVGFFIEAVMGFNVNTLRVFARVRQIVVIDALTIVLAVGLCVVLIPTRGAWGAAVAIATATITQNLLFQWTMLTSTGVGKMRWSYARFFTCCIALVTALAVVQWWLSPPLWLGAMMAAAGYFLLLWTNRSLIDVYGTFPELLRIPLLGRSLAAISKPDLAPIPEAKT